MNAVAHCDTTLGSLLNERAPMTGLAALLSTSTTGAKSTSKLAARSSRAKILPMRAASAELPTPSAPTSRIGGKIVMPSTKRTTRPPSWSIDAKIFGFPSAADSLLIARTNSPAPACVVALRANRITPLTPARSISRSESSTTVPANPTQRSRAASLRSASIDIERNVTVNALTHPADLRYRSTYVDARNDPSDPRTQLCCIRSRICMLWIWIANDDNGHLVGSLADNS